MNATVALSSRAQLHIQNITLDMETRSPGQGEEFLRIVATKLEQLTQFPELGGVHRGRLRRLLLLRFPYSLFYVFDAAQNTVTIISCFHDRSNPQMWR